VENLWGLYSKHNSSLTPSTQNLSLDPQGSVPASEPDPQVTLPAGIPMGIPAGYLCGPAPVSSLRLCEAVHGCA